MEYNTSRDRMQISEYGRNIQKMVETVIAIEDRDERTRKANLIVGVMSTLHPNVRDTVDWKHKLWDHLHIVANYRLDVDSPYPMPVPEIVNRRPEKLAYPESKIRFRFYGKNIEKMINSAKDMEDGVVKNTFINVIGSFMRAACRQWNDEVLPDASVINHLTMLSEGKIMLEAEEGAHDFGLSDKGQRTPNKYFQKNRSNNNNNRNNNKFNKYRNNNNRNRNK